MMKIINPHVAFIRLVFFLMICGNIFSYDSRFTLRRRNSFSSGRPSKYEIAGTRRQQMASDERRHDGHLALLTKADLIASVPRSHTTIHENRAFFALPPYGTEKKFVVPLRHDTRADDRVKPFATKAQKLAETATSPAKMKADRELLERHPGAPGGTEYTRPLTFRSLDDNSGSRTGPATPTSDVAARPTFVDNATQTKPAPSVAKTEEVSVKPTRDVGVGPETGPKPTTHDVGVGPGKQKGQEEATLIQAAWRGLQARNLQKEKRLAALKIQYRWKKNKFDKTATADAVALRKAAITQRKVLEAHQLAEQKRLAETASMAAKEERSRLVAEAQKEREETETKTRIQTRNQLLKDEIATKASKMREQREREQMAAGMAAEEDRSRLIADMQKKLEETETKTRIQTRNQLLKDEIATKASKMREQREREQMAAEDSAAQLLRQQDAAQKKYAALQAQLKEAMRARTAALDQLFKPVAEQHVAKAKAKALKTLAPLLTKEMVQAFLAKQRELKRERELMEAEDENSRKVQAQLTKQKELTASINVATANIPSATSAVSGKTTDTVPKPQPPTVFVPRTPPPQTFKKYTKAEWDAILVQAEAFRQKYFGGGKKPRRKSAPVRRPSFKFKSSGNEIVYRIRPISPGSTASPSSPKLGDAIVLGMSNLHSTDKSSTTARTPSTPRSRASSTLGDKIGGAFDALRDENPGWLD